MRTIEGVGLVQTDRKHLYIGGEWIAPASTDKMRVINAATEERLGSVPEASPPDVDRAVAAARRAFDSGWGGSLPGERAAALNRFATALEKRGTVWSKDRERATRLARRVATGTIG